MTQMKTCLDRGSIRQRLDTGGPHFGRRRPAKPAPVTDWIGEYGALCDQIKEIDALDAEADRAGRLNRVPSDLLARLRRVVGPGSGRPGWLGSVEAYAIAESGLGRALLQGAVT